MAGTTPAGDGQAPISPEAILSAWEDWCRRLEELALSGVTRSQAEQTSWRRAVPVGDENEKRAEGSFVLGHRIQWTVVQRFVGKWPQIRWEEQETKVVGAEGETGNVATEITGAVVRDGRAFLLRGTGAGGWIIVNVLRNVYDPDAPPSLVDYLTQHVLGCHGSQRPFCTPVPRGVRMWLRQAKGGHISFDRVEVQEDGFIVDWELDVAALPESERVDLLPYRSGRFVLQRDPPYLPVRMTYRGDVVDGSVSDIKRTVSYVEVNGVPLAKSVSFELRFEGSEGRLRHVLTEESEYELLGAELSADALSLRHFGLPDDVVMGPPEPGSFRPIKLALAAIALLLAGIGLGRWLRSLKRS